VKLSLSEVFALVTGAAIATRLVLWLAMVPPADLWSEPAFRWTNVVVLSCIWLGCTLACWMLWLAAKEFVLTKKGV